MKDFDIFRVNCWMEDLEDQKYESSISLLTYEFLVSTANKEVSLKNLFGNIKEELGIKIQFDTLRQIVSSDENLILESIDDDILLKLTDESLNNFREKQGANHIDNYIKTFLSLNDLPINLGQSIKAILFKTLYQNINTFITDDLKSLISEQVKNDFDEPDIVAFNQFLEWENAEKNKALYSLFSKTIEFAIVTSGRGVTEISKNIFTNKTYFLDANIILRGIGVDGTERRDSILSILDSCNHDGIGFKISKSTFDELNNSISRRTNDIKKNADPSNEEILKEIIEEIPLNNSFEVDYIKQRKEGKVSSVNNYKLHLEQALEAFTSRYNLKIEPIKGIQSFQLQQLCNSLYEKKKYEYSRFYSKGSALVDAKNILNIKLLRGGNNYNYKDIKSFYLTTDGTLNLIVADLAKQNIPETILPSQLYVIHNSFHKKTEDEDYFDFVNFLKMRRTEFKLSGKEIFTYMDQIRGVTSDKTDIINGLKGYANYRFKNIDKLKSEQPILSLKEYAATNLEKELSSKRTIADELDNHRRRAIARLPEYFSNSKKLAWLIELLGLLLVTLLFGKFSNSQTTWIAVGSIVLLRIINFMTKDVFGIHKTLRNSFLNYYVKKDKFKALYLNDKLFEEKVNEYRKNDI